MWGKSLVMYLSNTIADDEIISIADIKKRKPKLIGFLVCRVSRKTMAISFRGLGITNTAIEVSYNKEIINTLHAERTDVFTQIPVWKAFL